MKKYGSANISRVNGSGKNNKSREYTKVINSEKIEHEHKFSLFSKPYLSSEASAIVAEQRKYEVLDLEKESALPIGNIQKNIPMIRLDKLEKEVKDEFDQPGVMEAASKIIRGVYYHAGHGNGKLSESAEVANWFTSGKRIGAPSANGLVVITSIRDAKDIAIIKAPLKDDKQTDMVHEIFVATHGTNELRGLIPNFAYVYGGFQCAPSVFDSKGKLISLCGTGKKTQYIVYETIAPAIDFNTAVAGNEKTNTEDLFTPKTLYDAFLQIALATYMAWKRFDWTHYDLHHENVLLRRVPHHPEFLIRYEFEGMDVYVKSDRVSTIIDFGYSHIKVGGKHYGYAIPEYGVFPDHSNPLLDMYKLMLFVASSAVDDKRDDLIEVLAEFYRYFSSEDINIAVEKQIEYYYYLPESLSKELSLVGFINHMFQSFPEYEDEIYSSTSNVFDPDLPVLGCHNNCATASSVTKNLIDLNEIQSVIDIYDLHVDGLADEMIMKRFYNNFDVAMNRHIEEMDELNKEYLHDKNVVETLGVSASEIREMQSSKLYTKETLQNLQKYRDHLLRGSFILSRLEVYIVAGRHIAVIYSNDKYIEKFNKLSSQYRKYKDDMKKERRNAMATEKALKDRSHKNEDDRIIRNNRIFEWYKNPL